jgi:nicotinate-nucleotide adenylyltransferase
MQNEVPFHPATLRSHGPPVKPHAPSAAGFVVPRFVLPPLVLPRFGDRRAIRIGILGGSFNPAHAGHLQLARLAMKRLRLQQVWLLVSPGNPLKHAAGMAPAASRLASARAIADGRRIIATDIERHLHTRYTSDTLRALRRRFPRATFVWLMGADNLVQLPRWRGWLDIARHTPFAVMPRPTYNHRALAGQAARRLRAGRIAAPHAPALARWGASGWVFLDARQNPLSATQLRQNAGWESGMTVPTPARTQPGETP